IKLKFKLATLKKKIYNYIEHKFDNKIKGGFYDGSEYR
ncbi:MAG: hypothetical protein Q612_NSC00038G0003, partial [Negativicoccus succinicivorans DORA_17_25]